MSKPFFESLCQLCRQDRLAAKWVFVPRPRYRWTLAERLVLAGVDWLNLRLTTPFELALEIAAPYLLEEGLDPTSDDLGPSLMVALVQGQHFGPVRQRPGVGEALWKTVQEFRMAGLVSADLKPNGHRPEEFRGLLSAYENWLDQQGRCDRARVFRTAIRKVKPVDQPTLEFPHHWSGLERAFLDQLKGKVQKVLCHGPTTRRVSLLARVSWSPERWPENLQVIRSERVEAEVESVLAKIRSVPLDQVEVVVANPRLVSTVRDRLVSEDIPLTCEAGWPLSISSQGQLALGLLDWLEHGLSALDLRRLVSRFQLTAPVPGSIAARLLEQAQASWGRSGYREALVGLGKRLRSLAQRRERQQDQFRELADQADRLTEVIECLIERLTGPNWVSELGSLVDCETEAGRRLRRLLVEIQPVVGLLEPDALRRRLRHDLASLRFGRERPKPGHLHLAEMKSLGVSGRAHCLVLGLVEGEWLPTCQPDPVLTDQERATLSPCLQQSTDKPMESWFEWWQRLADFSGSLVLSYSLLGPEGEEQTPAWPWAWAAAQSRPKPRSLAEWKASETGWWLARTPGEVEVVARAFPNLARGLEATRQRRMPLLSRFDGLVEAAVGVLDPRRTHQPISVSRLQDLAACPFRYFLEQGLGLRPEKLSRPRADQWLDAATRGTVLHEVFAGYHRERRAGRSVDAHSLLDRELEKVRATLTPPSQAVESWERESLRNDVQNFLKLEGQSPGKPVGVEVGFGLPDTEGEALAQTEPVPLLGLALRGRIDRIDRHQGGFEVLDYKTGRSLGVGPKSRFEQGRLLQHALYALVAEQLLGEKVTHSSYYFPAVGAKEVFYRFARPEPEELAQVLERILAPLESGAFVHTETSQRNCRYCDFARACTAHRDEDTKAKLNNLDNDRLSQRRRLLDTR